MFPLSSHVTELYFFSNLFFVMKITVAFLFQHSSMLTSSIIEVEINYNSSLNVIILLRYIPLFHFITRMLYI